MIVMDASALLCLFKKEPGADNVLGRVQGSLCSAVNWSEVMQKLAFAGYDNRTLFDDATELGVTVVPFTAQLAESTANLFPFTKHKGLSLADRACLATAMLYSLPALTCERAWDGLDFPAKPEIVLAR